MTLIKLSVLYTNLDNLYVFPPKKQYCTVNNRFENQHRLNNIKSNFTVFFTSCNRYIFIFAT